MTHLNPLAGFFNPSSIAVVGVSQDTSKVGSRTLRYLIRHGFIGTIYGVSPKVDRLFGVMCYRSVTEIPEPVDLVIIAVPATHVPGILQESGKRGVKYALVFSAGFGETGAEGRALEVQLRHIAQATGIRVAGPNCIGVVSLVNRVAASWSNVMERSFYPGNIGFLSQSGGLGVAIFSQAEQDRVGFSHFVTTGNEVDLGFSDFLTFLVADHNTQVIAGYIEGIRNGPAFIEGLDCAMRAGKPVILLKCGRSSTGKMAAATHTGSLAGEDAVYDGIFKQYGVIRARNVQELLDFSVMLSLSRPSSGRRMGIISSSGGANVLMADECDNLGIEIPRLTEATAKKLKSQLPAFAAADNPVDVADAMGRTNVSLGQLIRDVAEDERIDVVHVFLNVLYMVAPRLCEELWSAYHSISKPLAVTWLGGPEEVVSELRHLGIPAFDDPSRAIGAIKALCLHSDRRLNLPPSE